MIFVWGCPDKHRGLAGIVPEVTKYNRGQPDQGEKKKKGFGSRLCER